MRSLKFISFVFFVSVILMSCSTGQRQPDDPLLKEAFGYHSKAMEVEKSLQSVIKELNAKKSTIQSAGKELGEDDMKFIDITNNIEKSYHRWQGNRVEVPGFHDHSKCNGDHGKEAQLTPQQMLEIQKESMENIKDMLTKAEVILEK